MIRQRAGNAQAVMRHATFAALLTAVLLTGCGGDDSAPQDSSQATTTAAAAAPPSAPESGPVDTINIKEFLFDPTPATVRAGQKISVVNDDKAPHTLTDQPESGRPQFDTGNITGNSAGSFVAPKAGSYAYFCELHAFMKGKLEVVP